MWVLIRSASLLLMNTSNINFPGEMRKNLGTSNEYPQCMFSWRNKENKGASNEYPQHLFLWRNKKNTSNFWLKKVLYTVLFKEKVSKCMYSGL